MFGISAFAQSTFASLSVEDVTVALTGDEASGAVGTAGVNISVALTGISASGFVGTVTPSESVGETGDAASGFVGTVAPSISVALTGVTASGFVGSVAVSHTNALTGVSAAGFVGSVIASQPIVVIKPITIDDVAVFGGGVFGMASFAGDVKQTYTPDSTKEGTAQGFVGFVTSNISVALTGLGSSGFVGTVTPNTSYAEAGDAAQGFVGAIDVNVSVALTGLSASGVVGSVTPAILPVETGDVAQGFVGTVGVNVSVALTGLSASGLIGTIGKNYWLPIDDAQTPNWTPVIKYVTIDDVAVFGGGIFAMSPYAGQINQTYAPSNANWALVDDAETAGWTLINATSS